MLLRRPLFLTLLFSVLFGTGFSALAQHAPEEGHTVPGAHGTEVHATEAHGAEAHGEKKLDVAGEIFSHVGDAHSWHIFSVGEKHVTIPLPVIAWSQKDGLHVFSSSEFGHHETTKMVAGKPVHVSESAYGFHLERGIKEKLVADDPTTKAYDFSITKNVVCMLISVVLLLWIMLSVAKKYKANGAMKAPSGFQNAVEPVITFIRDEVAKPNLGHKWTRFMPLLLTMFFFIWINNLLGLLPLGFNFTGNIAVTLCLAIISFLVMVFNGNKHFWGHLFNPPGVPLGIKFLLVPIEIISMFIKPVALTIRLFANILAGHILILSVVMLIFIFTAALSPAVGIGFSPVSLAFAVFMFFLELLVAAIQAFIFTNLTAVFVGQAIEEAHHHDHEAEDYHAHNPKTGQEYNVGTQEIIA